MRHVNSQKSSFFDLTLTFAHIREKSERAGREGERGERERERERERESERERERERDLDDLFP